MFAFARQHVRPLAFGALHSFYSAPGQTFFIGLFVVSFGADFGLDPAGVGALYLAGTLASAATLLFVGHWIDHIRLVHFSAAVVVGCAIACLVTSLAVGPLTLFFGLYLLRLTGQGLMVHVEATATARTFDRERGRALGITALGIPISEIIFPPLVVAGIAAIGWRPTYALVGAVALFVLLPLTQWLLYGITRSPRREGGTGGAFRSLLAGLRVLLRSRYVWAALPAMAVLPFYATAIMFHITTMADIRGWPVGFVAASFPALAIANVCGLFISGQIIDRVSARKLFMFQMIPLLCGMTVLGMVTAPWALPVVMASIGFSGGLSKTTLTAVWAELFGTETLGTIRSAVAMYMVLISALAPFVLGALLSAGWSIEVVMTWFVIIGVVCITPPVIAERYAFR
ncbi:MFS transporter [Bauldia litoralis]|uniref:Predicted arabinose efflux permease, MFS family n=1 Tax=Bauldia litoralis TaxID=665467 RepID=A0A1G6DRG2_9HYPH|nr:MFS transporter [Bauldia litoralis]SDB47706.1 Predicted arabinose efflux permease, MFS family [Bauldia litoralis]